MPNWRRSARGGFWGHALESLAMSIRHIQCGVVSDPYCVPSSQAHAARIPGSDRWAKYRSGKCLMKSSRCQSQDDKATPPENTNERDFMVERHQSFVMSNGLLILFNGTSVHADSRDVLLQLRCGGGHRATQVTIQDKICKPQLDREYLDI